MRIYLIICLLFISHLCFAQSDPGKRDSTSSRSTAHGIDHKHKKKNAETTAPVPPVPVEEPNTLLPKIYYAGFFLGGVILTLAFRLISRRGEFRGSTKGKINIGRLSVTDQELINDLRDQNDKLSKSKRLLEKRIEVLEAQIPKVAVPKEESITSTIPIQPVNEEASFTKEWEVGSNITNLEAIKESYQSVLYFSTPNRSGEFRGGSNTFEEGASIYKFSLISPTEAFFEFCDNRSSVGLALNHRNDLILAVAEESNAFNPGASRIAIDGNQQGQALLEGSFWKVTKKAKIKYI